MEVGFFKRGSAQAARTIDQRLAVLRDLLRETDLELADPETVRDLRAFYQRGTEIRALLIDIVHGDASGGAAPDLIATKRAMNEWIEAAEALLASQASH